MRSGCVTSSTIGRSSCGFGVASRPPSSYAPVSEGDNYQVWQRREDADPILEHYSLGSRVQPSAVAPCAEILRLGHLAAANDGLVAAVDTASCDRDRKQRCDQSSDDIRPLREYSGALYPLKPTSVTAHFVAPRKGSYDVWVGGSFRSRIDVSVDGNEVGEARNVLQWPGNFIQVARVPLSPGPHSFDLDYSGRDLHPGSGGTPPWGLGPFAVTQGTQNQKVKYVTPANARSLCGKTLDWVEALSG